jgi:hypothetical protein
MDLHLDDCLIAGVAFEGAFWEPPDSTFSDGAYALSCPIHPTRLFSRYCVISVALLPGREIPGSRPAMPERF